MVALKATFYIITTINALMITNAIISLAEVKAIVITLPEVIDVVVPTVTNSTTN